MKILTLNTWQERGPWEKRWEVIFEGLRQRRPDIACFQELFNGEWASRVKSRLGFRNLVLSKGPFGLAILTNYHVMRSGELALSRSPLESYLRGLLWAQIGVGRKSLFVLCTHLSWMLTDGESRKNQLNDILLFIRRKVRSEEMLLTGDLNASPYTGEIRWFLENGGFRDLYREKHPGKDGFTWDNRRNRYVAACDHRLPDRRIDYILARGDGPLLEKAGSCTIEFGTMNNDGIFASDHFGVMARFS